MKRHYTTSTVYSPVTKDNGLRTQTVLEQALNSTDHRQARRGFVGLHDEDAFGLFY